jgi:hypothetical protein
VLIRVYRLEVVSLVGILISTQLCEIVAPSNLLSDSTLSLPTMSLIFIRLSNK